MAEVHIPSGLRGLTGGVGVLEVNATDVRSLIEALDQLFPGLGDRLRDGVAVAVDGEIIAEPMLEQVDAESEVHFLPSISGG